MATATSLLKSNPNIVRQIQDLDEVDSQLATLPCFNKLRFLHPPKQDMRSPPGFLGVHLGETQSSCPQYVISFDAAWKKETRVMGCAWTLHLPSASLQFVANGGGAYGLASSALHAESQTLLLALQWAVLHNLQHIHYGLLKSYYCAAIFIGFSYFDLLDY